MADEAHYSNLHDSPAPDPGRTWHLPDLIEAGVPFKTLLGTFAVDDPAATPALDNMSLHYWYLAPGEEDDQIPHKQDEAYFILKGQGKVTVNGEERPVREGDLIFVPRCAAHRFHGYDETGLAILIFFSPNYTSGV
jgi:mannose-6-phosphate isomerase-like protein (cupin superfamily)